MKKNVITITEQSGAWMVGRIGGYKFEIKHFDEPSIYGINEGRISKLFVRRESDRTVVANFDRGWDVEPETDDAKEIVDTLYTLWG